MKKDKYNNIIPFPNLEKRLLNKGMDALNEKRYKDALQIFKQFTAHYTDYPEVEVGIVVCLLELGLYEDAKEKCEWLLQHDIGDYFYVMQIYITVLIQLSEYDKVVSILEALFEEEKVPSTHAGELFHLLEFARKSSGQHFGIPDRNQTSANVQMLGAQLVNGNYNEQLHAIQLLRSERTISEIIEDLRTILADREAHPIIQSMVLQLMMEKEMQDIVVVTKFGKTMKVNPSTVVNIFDQPFTIQVLNKLEDMLSHENPTLYESVKELWERFLLVLFPFQPQPLDVMVWAGALHKSGYQFFGIDITNDELEDIYNVSVKKIEKACDEILEMEKISMFEMNE